VQLANEIGDYTRKLVEDYEDLDKITIQADLWHSKYQASRYTCVCHVFHVLNNIQLKQYPCVFLIHVLNKSLLFSTFMILLFISNMSCYSVRGVYNALLF